MPRVKRGYTLRRKRKRLLKLAKGFRGPRGNLYRIAREAVDRALNFAYRDRRARKRDFRRLWITRINAAARSNDTSYSRLIAGLAKANVAIDRKILSDMAVTDAASFSRLVAISREN
jgi:large subunit ribosomal protein L20